MERVLANLASGKLSTYAAIILMFTYTILLDKDFACTCKPQDRDCYFYIAMPVFIIFLLILWTDRSFQRVCRLLCSGAFAGRDCLYNSHFGFFLCKLLKAALVGLLWVAFVYINGDWYVCCQNDHSEQQAQLACKDRRRITDEERVLIAELKNTSRVIGVSILFGIVAVTSLMPLFGWKKCCGKTRCCNRKLLYEKLILEEEGNVLKEILRESAKEKLLRKVQDKIQDDSMDCFDAAEELIKASRPTISEQEQQRRQPGEQEMENQERRINYGTMSLEEGPLLT